MNTFGSVCKRLSTNDTFLLVLHNLDTLGVQGLLEFRQVNVYKNMRPELHE